MDKFQPKGIWHIVGAKDSGKTLAGITAYPPNKTAYIFDDVKPPPVDPDKFGLYVDLNKEFGKRKLLEFAMSLEAMINRIKYDEIDSIVFDTWGRPSLALRMQAKQTPFRFREKETYSRMGAIKGSEEWKEANRFEAMLISSWMNKVKAIFLISHVKDEYAAGAKTGNQIPDVGSIITQICNARIWLEPTNIGPPIVLIPKRMSKIEFLEDGSVRPINVAPRVIRPQVGDTTVWSMIDRYWQNPMNGREPEEHEIPTARELALLDGILSPSQTQIWQEELREKRRKEDEAKEYLRERYDEFKGQVLLSKEEFPDLPIPMAAKKIHEKLQKEFSDYLVVDVVKVLSK